MKNHRVKAFFLIIFCLCLLLNTQGQNFGYCRYPVDVSADSLFRYVTDEEWRNHYPLKPDHIEQMRKQCFDVNDTLVLDSAFNICQKHIRNKLGQTVFCKSIRLGTSSFSRQGDIPGLRILTFHYQPLTFLHDFSKVNTQFDLHRKDVWFNYYIHFTDREHFSIIYPDNIPDCDGTPDCNYTINLDKAISIANKKEFILPHERYIIQTDGHKWIIISIDRNYKRTGRALTINLINGRSSEFSSKQNSKEYKKEMEEKKWIGYDFYSEELNKLRGPVKKEPVKKEHVQETDICAFQPGITLDSLFRYTVIQEYRPGFYAVDSSQMVQLRTETMYDKNDSIKLDSAFTICLNHITNKLGKPVFCKYVRVTPGSFSRRSPKDGLYEFTFYMQTNNFPDRYTILRSNVLFLPDQIAYNYIIRFKDKHHFRIKYPIGVPDCNGTEDCGFKAGFEKAIAVADKIDLIMEHEKYFMQFNGMQIKIITRDNTGRQTSEKLNFDLKSGNYYASGYISPDEEKRERYAKAKQSQENIAITESVSSFMLDVEKFKACRVPVSVNADSLFEYAKQKYIAAAGTSITPELIEHWTAYKYDKNDENNLDDAFKICQKHLISKLGENVYCKYINLTIDGFSRKEYLPGLYRLTYLFEPSPILNKNNSSNQHYMYQKISYDYLIQFFSDKQFEITFPNVPDCNGTEDCGYIITLDKAVEIAFNAKFLNDTIRYNIQSDGFNWIITTYDTCSRSTMNSLQINLKTGKYSITGLSSKQRRENESRRETALKESKNFDDSIRNHRKIIESITDKYILNHIKDNAIRKKIVKDAFQPVYDPSMVLYRVNNDSNLADNNLIIIHVTKENTINTDLTRVDPDYIRAHVKSPSGNPLYLSYEGAKGKATVKGLEEGFEPWRIHIFTMDDIVWQKDFIIKWEIRSTTSKGCRSGGGNLIHFSADGLDCPGCGVIREWSWIE